MPNGENKILHAGNTLGNIWKHCLYHKNAFNAFTWCFHKDKTSMLFVSRGGQRGKHL